MGLINLKWRDALLIAGGEFEPKEQAAGWPDRMNAGQLAALQRPRHFTPVSTELNGQPFFVGNFPRASRPENKRHRAILDLLNQEFEAGHGPDTPYLFTAWLAAHGEPPSSHIRAWFDSVGFNSTPKIVATGVQTHAQSGKDLADRNDLWLTYFEIEEKSAQKGALQRTAANLNADRSTVGKALKNAKKLRAEKYRAGSVSGPDKSKKPASPFPTASTTTVRAGKTISR